MIPFNILFAAADQIGGGIVSLNFNHLLAGD
jgi:hypothetical protein